MKRSRETSSFGAEVSTVGPGRFLSLRWKLVGSLLLLSLPIGGLFALMFNQHILRVFDETRTHTRERYERQVNGLLRQQRLHLERMTTALPVLSETGTPEGSLDPDEVNRKFAAFWSSFQMDLGIADADYFDATGGLLVHWDGNTDTSPPPADQRLRNAVARVLTDESPTSWISCSDRCQVHALAPILIQGQPAGAFGMTSSLADTVLTFADTAPAELVVLAPSPAEDRSASHIAAWSLHIEAASNKPISYRIISDLSDRISFAALAAAGMYRLDRGGRQIEVAQIRPSADNHVEDLYFLVVEDITNGLAETGQATRNAFAIVILTTALSMILLYVILGRHLRRVLKTAGAIPLLGVGEFETLRRTLTVRERKRYDEIDQLDRTAIGLSHQLQQLERKIALKTESLEDALRELSREKEFVASLLEHAQAIIVTSDEHGRILSMNNYGFEMTGYHHDEVIGTALIGSRLLPTPPENLRDRLQMIVVGQHRHLRHEASLARNGGTESHEVSWVHTRLWGEQSGSATLLSVGLDISERKKNEEQLAFLADHDPLTRCFNRRRFNEELERMLETAERSNLQGALLYLDLDRFKSLNDTYGHQAGDSLLKNVADVLHNTLRGSDVLGRLGGDEFAIAMFNSSIENATEVARRVNQRLNELPTGTENPNYRITASIGIALFPEPGMGAKELLVNADIAMYKAKEGGRSAWHLFQQEERTRVREDILWQERIEHALRHRKGGDAPNFHLYLQPVIRLSDRQIVHFEVLLRLILADGSVIGPAQFLSVAERNNLMRRIDRWVVKESLRLLVTEQAERHPFSLAVNLSGRTIGDDRLLKFLRRASRLRLIDPSRVILEITETAAVADFALAREFVNEVRSYGYTFALDDFGSGFSSFFYLKQFPVDCVKIDGAFIRNLTDSSDDQIFVEAMVRIARHYGKKTVAEFVESESLLEMLHRYGVDFAQGYHTGRPAPATQALAMLDTVPSTAP